MKKEERKNRIIARGEVTDHAHIIIGEAKVRRQNDNIVIDVFGSAKIKHLVESNWINEGIEVWTGEHTDIELKPGKYEYIPQVEYDPYEDAIRRVQD
jgi:hypothetical protein